MGVDLKIEAVACATAIEAQRALYSAACWTGNPSDSAIYHDEKNSARADAR